MKRFIAVLLLTIFTLVVTTSFGGCSSEKKSLRIMVDLPRSEEIQSKLEMYLLEIEAKGGPDDVELEIIPSSGSERESALTRIRTEVMAGQGPDLYVVGYMWGTELGSDGERKNTSLFLMPEKNMMLGLFYPLDDFIENAQFMDIDAMVPAIREAGKTEEWGQVLLPLGYTFETTFFLKSDVPEVPVANTWDDMLNSGLLLQASAASPETFTLTGEHIAYTFGQLADYSKRQLLFTEEDLLERVNQAVQLETDRANGAFEEIPDYFQYYFTDNLEMQNLGLERNGGTDFIPDLIPEIETVTEQELTMVPIYSNVGGVTAIVHSFAAINANSKRAEDAFFILDYLFSKDLMKSSGMMHDIRGMYSEIPVYAEFMNTENPVWANTYNWYMTDENFAEFCRVRDQITTVRFAGSLDLELSSLFSQCLEIAKGYSNGDVPTLVHQTYSRMKQEVSE